MEESSGATPSGIKAAKPASGALRAVGEGKFGQEVA
jgi:hypothetical protein